MIFEFGGRRLFLTKKIVSSVSKFESPVCFRWSQKNRIYNPTLLTELGISPRGQVTKPDIDKFVESCSSVCPGQSVSQSLTHRQSSKCFVNKQKGKCPCQLSVGRQYYSQIQSTTYPDCSFRHQHLPCL